MNVKNTMKKSVTIFTTILFIIILFFSNIQKSSINTSSTYKNIENKIINDDEEDGIKDVSLSFYSSSSIVTTNGTDHMFV